MSQPKVWQTKVRDFKIFITKLRDFTLVAEKLANLCEEAPVQFAVFGLLIFVAILVIVVFSAAVSTYNGLVSLKNQVDRAWANIDVLLKERFDLVPRMISVCEQFTKYERGTFDRIIQARQAYGAAGSVDEKIKAQGDVAKAVRGLLAIGEAYPQLKSSEQFVELEHTLKELENQIADRRELFNNTVTNFNTRCQVFPDAMFAGILGYKPMGLFHVEANEREMPTVKMDLPA